ncbi:MAG: DUF4296 domain-containing protein [Chitinophagaceae bacterium]
MRWMLIAVIAAFLTGCGSKKTIPKDIIPPDKMKLIMYDMLRTGEFLSGYVLYKDINVDKTAESMKWYNKVWQIHKINEDEFRKSYEWYRLHPSEMEAVMDSVMVIPTPPNPVHADSVVVKSDSMRQDSIRLRGLLKGRTPLQDSLRKDSIRLRRLSRVRTPLQDSLRKRRVL